MILKTKLKDYQVRAVRKLIKIKIGALYCEMGTGKTRIALELISERLNQSKVDAVLWFCPCSVKQNLIQDIIKHVGELPKCFIIAGIESLSSSDKLYLKLLNYVANSKVYLIVDESNLVKNGLAMRTKRITELSQYCTYKLILNGTPVSKNEKDLFSQWYILDWRILGYKSFWSFSNNHLEYDDYGKIRRVLHVDYLTKKISPYTFQINKDECLQLPRKHYSKYGFRLTVTQLLHYNSVKELFLSEVDEFAPTTLYRLFTALQHVTIGNRVTSEVDEKIKTEDFFKSIYENPRIIKLIEILDDIEGKTIIWCKYTKEILEIEQMLIDKYGSDSVVKFYGKLNRVKRFENIESFKDSARFFVANKTCAGYGLNLQFCNNSIYYNNDWDWATRAQSEDRIHRIGQEKDVNLIDLFAYDTLDSRILRCLEKKERLVDGFKTEIWKNNKNDVLSKWIDGKEIGNDTNWVEQKRQAKSS